MSVDFFKVDCREVPRTDKRFGLCDDEDGSRAYSDIADDSKWIATVKNDDEVPTTFTAIDNCITILQKGSEHDKESTCDGMLTFGESIYLMELKAKGADWIPKATAQLENTIKFISTDPKLADFKYKKAFACNKRHPRFRVIDNEKKKKFFKEYGFRLDINATIVIK